MTVRVAAAVLLKDHRVLLGHRHPARTNYPDVWDLPGGHIEVGETAAEAITRELAEELAIDVSGSVLHPWQTVWVDDIEMTIFVLDSWTGTVRNAQPAEHDALDWFDAENLTDLALANVRYPQLLGAAVAENRASRP